MSEPVNPYQIPETKEEDILIGGFIMDFMLY